ncbi:ankyrin repeat domain-containing protein [Roseomonas sp. E05]|uniref:ankyrin repeat domain-containing protein n=1 Tax=Roseomonas sp. E05 TaxID=3046310 RepID=UPI0024BA9747|nr:ankyrin repeat domain-containing protein [Roseomonas sp. E05]MDJ0387047.1 ankyrin repeat domain-containing protein [Roseomonas sp. E05]
MQNDNTRSPPEMDEELIAFAGRVFQCARGGDAAMLEDLLRQGLPPNLRNDKGDTLVMLAAYHGHGEAVRVLLEHGADPDSLNDRGQTPLAAAAFKGAGEVVALLLKHGAAVDGCGPDGRTPLMLAAMFNRVEILQQLLAAGADPAARDAAGHTARAAAETMGAADTPALLPADPA